MKTIISVVAVLVLPSLLAHAEAPAATENYYLHIPDCNAFAPEIAALKYGKVVVMFVGEKKKG